MTEEELEFNCANFLICKNTAPKWLLDMKGDICIHCDIMFGKWKGGKGILPILPESECPVCLEDFPLVQLPRCDHGICISCFRRSFYGNLWSNEGEPSFPYPEIKDEYYEGDEEDPKWKTYPLIEKHHFDWNKWDDEKQEQYEKESYLRQCPLCRQ